MSGQNDRVELAASQHQISMLNAQRAAQQDQLAAVRRHAESVLGAVRSAGVDMHKWRRELSDAFPSSSYYRSSRASRSSSRSSTSSTSSSSSCASPQASVTTSPSSSASSSPTSSPAVSRGPSSKRLHCPDLELLSLQRGVQAGAEQLADARSRTAALEEQLPLIQALATQPGTQHRPHGIAAALRNMALRTALCGQPPVAVPPLHPGMHCDGATLLKLHTRPVASPDGAESEEACPGTASVWLLHVGASAYVAKVEPCHSAAAEAELAAGSLEWGSVDERAPLRRVAAAAAEAAHAATVNDACAVNDSDSGPVLAPVAVFVRDCSLRHTSLCVGHDKEVVTLYPYCPSGDAYAWVGEVAEGAARQAGRGSRGVAAAARGLAAELQSLTRDMLRAVADVHAAGWMLGDHKLENMVRCPLTGRWLLIDAAGAACVRDCPDGWLSGRGTYTEIYAAPEQLQKGRRARRGQPSDVFAVGVSVEEVVEQAAERFGRAAGQAWREGRPGCSRRAMRGAEWRAKTAVRVAARRLGLMKLAWRCTAEDPAQRPVMADVCERMGC